MKLRHWIMGALLIGTAWLAFTTDKPSASSIVEASARPKQSEPRGISTSVKTTPAINVLTLKPRDTLIGTDQSSTQTSLFSSQSWTPPPPPPSPPPKPVPPPPPTAPPVPFVYLGKKLEDSRWEVYLSRDTKTYVVTEQTLIEGMYKVESIKPPLLSLIYLPLKILQTISIGVAE